MKLFCCLLFVLFSKAATAKDLPLPEGSMFGLPAGTKILGIDGRKFTDVKTAIKLLEETRDKDLFTLMVQNPDGSTYEVTVQINP